MTFAGGDGSSREQAVLIHGTTNNDEARAAEKEWLEKKYPSLRMIIRQPTLIVDQCYDMVAFVTKEGQTNRAHFKYANSFSE